MAAVTSESMLALVYSGIDSINAQRSDKPPVPKKSDTVLFGSASSLDSLGLVNLVVAVEEKIEELYGCSIALADDRAFSQPVSPFTNVGTLAAYIETLLKEKGL